LLAHAVAVEIDAFDGLEPDAAQLPSDQLSVMRRIGERRAER
jgi:hypothetical protein